MKKNRDAEFQQEEEGLERFIEVQDGRSAFGESYYDDALKEITNGRKESHWIWFIFPQLQGLGFSLMCQRYGVRGLAEAKAYLKNETLRKRLVEITTALLMHSAKRSAETILGEIDALKVRSCMTLFSEAAWDNGQIAEYEQFNDVLDAFYDGKRDKRTDELIRNWQNGNR